jgi:3-hydroxybutyryl-CoA dehydrogenase
VRNARGPDRTSDDAGGRVDDHDPRIRCRVRTIATPYPEAADEAPAILVIVSTIRPGLSSPAVAAGLIGVVGLGTMGAGIAQVSAHHGLRVVGCDVSDEALARGRARIEEGYRRHVARERMTPAERDEALARVRTTIEPAELADCDLVIEAIVEEIAAKRELFARLDAICRPEAVLATNTSALSVTEIAAAAQRPERVIGLHFFNPAPVLPLVEVVRGGLSSPEAVEAGRAFAEAIGKQPVVCADTPGFIVNRILVPLLNDCVRLYEAGGVEAEDLDRAMKAGLGWPIGPLALIDLIGADIHVHASEAIWDAYREPRFAPPALLVRMARAGQLGRKSGCGFFSYES